MREITTKVYSFSELSEDAKQKAIDNIRNSYYEYNDFSEWAIDDCYLLQPKELMNDELIIENNRKIYFSLDRNRYIDISKAMEIQDVNLFLKWLGLDESLIDKIDFDILSDSIVFMNQSDEEFTDIEWEKLNNAEEKFGNHCDEVLNRIEADIDYRFTDEAIIESITSNDYEFTEDGKEY